MVMKPGNMKLQQLLEELFSIRGYFGRFAVVGVSGIIVNEGLLFLLTESLEMKVALAGLISIECSIITNFLLNNFWTWRDRRTETFFIRLFRYHAVTAISGGTNYIILLLLTHTGMHHLLANLIGIGVGMLINFLFNHYWTFSESGS
jgi:dolichol-phosphate mannosyltransferase